MTKTSMAVIVSFVFHLMFKRLKDMAHCQKIINLLILKLSNVHQRLDALSILKKKVFFNSFHNITPSTAKKERIF